MNVGDLQINGGTFDTGGFGIQYMASLDGWGTITNTVGGTTNLYVGDVNSGGYYGGTIGYTGGGFVNLTKTGANFLNLGGGADNWSLSIAVQGAE